MIQRLSAVWTLAAYSIFTPIWAHGDESTRGRHGPRSAASPNPSASPSAGTIRGTCSVLASASNPFSGPCVNITLILNDSSGEEQERVRTNPQGQFEFNASPNTDYHIVPGSKLYDQPNSTRTIHSGDRIELKLKQN